MQAFRLEPRGYFHFGIHGIDAEQSAERCPSDTLYSALLAESLRWGLDFYAPPDGHSADAAPDPPLLLSSAFPYAGEILLLPRPQLKLPVTEREGGRKKLKRLEYVSPTIFTLILAGGTDSLDPYVEDQGRLLMNGKVWIANQDGVLPRDPRSGVEITKFWSIEQVPHVTVDRAQDSSAYYQVGQVAFAPQCGLYLLYAERQAGAGAVLRSALARLGDSGLGGRRSAGLGQFAVREAVAPVFPSVSAARRMVLLSRYRPTAAEIAAGVFGDAASYSIVRVGGWLQTGANAAAQRRRNVRMLGEGSVICLAEDGSPPLGSICDLRPEYDAASFPHPVWRYGLALGPSIGGAA
jgi:CRISPR-associated protein Csm4